MKSSKIILILKNIYFWFEIQTILGRQKEGNKGRSETGRGQEGRGDERRWH